MYTTLKNLSKDHSNSTGESNNKEGGKSHLELGGGCIGIIIVFIAVWLLLETCS